MTHTHCPSTQYKRFSHSHKQNTQTHVYPHACRHTPPYNNPIHTQKTNTAWNIFWWFAPIVHNVNVQSLFNESSHNKQWVGKLCHESCITIGLLASFPSSLLEGSATWSAPSWQRANSPDLMGVQYQSQITHNCTDWWNMHSFPRLWADLQSPRLVDYLFIEKNALSKHSLIVFIHNIQSNLKLNIFQVSKQFNPLFHFVLLST